MRRRRIIVLLASLATIVAAVAVAGALWRDASPPDDAAGVEVTPTATPAATRDPRLHSPRSFLSVVDAVCSGLTDATPISASAPLAERAASMRDEAESLERLLTYLRGIRVPATLREPMRGYRRRLLAQIRLDRVIAAAADDGDRTSVELGTEQNDWNRSERSKLAKQMGFSSCLADNGGG